MSQPDVLATNESDFRGKSDSQKRKLADAVWQPFLQYRLLLIMLGTTVVVAAGIGLFLYFAFSDMIGIIDNQGNSKNYYGEMIGKELVNIFRYTGALFMLYVILLAAICITYTHRVAGPLHPFSKHIDELRKGNYSHRVTLRQKDLPLYNDYADKLNALAGELENSKSQA